MKILWFANTPCGASEHLHSNSQAGGWLSSLEKKLTVFDSITLHICFLWHSDIPCFSIGRTTYHPVRRTRMRDILLGQFPGFHHPDPVQTYADVIARVKPDLIHVHGTEENFGLIQAVIDIPVVVSIQGILSNCYYKYFSDISPFRFLANERIRDHLKLKSVLSNYLIFVQNAARERKIFALTKHVIGRTEWDRRSTALLAPSVQYNHCEEILRPFFYEIAWSRSKFSIPLRLVTVSSAAPYKGFEAILKVAKILKNHADIKFIWNVVGLSAKDIVVKTVHKWLGEQSEVHLLGPLPGNEVRDLLLESDIFCQVSHIENSSNSLCEAMLLGMPIVANFAGGTDSMLCAGEEGILVQDGDPISMAGAILELSREYKRAALMGKAARARAFVRHDPDRIISELLLTYRHLLRRHV